MCEQSNPDFFRRYFRCTLEIFLFYETVINKGIHGKICD